MTTATIARLQRLAAQSAKANKTTGHATLFADGEPVVAIALVKPGAQKAPKGYELGDMPMVTHPTWFAFFSTDAYYAQLSQVERFTQEVVVHQRS